MKSIYNRLILSIFRNRMSLWFLKHIVARVRLSTDYCKFDGKSFHKLRNSLRTGDILLKKDMSSLTGMTIGGKWSHVGVFVGHQDYDLIEMVGSGINKGFLFDFCRESDYVSACRPNVNEEYILGTFVSNLHKYVGKSIAYDFNFNLYSEDKMYCSELVYHADSDHLIVNKRSVILGEDVITPDDVYNSNVIEIFTNRG